MFSCRVAIPVAARTARLASAGNRVQFAEKRLLKLLRHSPFLELVAREEMYNGSQLWCQENC